MYYLVLTLVMFCFVQNVQYIFSSSESPLPTLGVLSLSFKNIFPVA